MTELKSRPSIETIDSADELRRWYWLKSELAAEARRLGLKVTGAKFTLLDRICHFYETGDKAWPGDARVKATSTFDWQTETLTTATRITDNYKNTQNVRRFFERHAGPGFKFNVALLDWFKSNTGRTLGDALAYWQAEQVCSPTRSKIKPHNQFNQYCRDFLDDNPHLGMQDAREAWAVKRSLPSETGRHVYARSDLEFIQQRQQEAR